MTQPNLLVIHTDEQSSWTIGACGGDLVQTPHIDRLAREGANLTEFFTNCAVCTPSRGCLMTGRYPHAHGAWRNNLPLNPDEVTFAEILRRHGYQTGYAGKWHLDGQPRPGWVHPERSFGFSDCRYMFNRGHWKRLSEYQLDDVQPVVYPYDDIGDEHEYTTDWLTTKTIDFVRRAERPFCHMLSIPDPHMPFTVREPYASMYRPQDMPVPASFWQQDQPDWIREELARLESVGRHHDEAVLRRHMAAYCGEVKCIDDNVGRLLAALEEQGILDDTIVVFTTDHGDHMGAHGFMCGKNELYLETYRIPFLVRWPERIPAGLRVDELISTVDVQPTLLGLLGLPAAGREQGLDASALLTGETPEYWPDAVFMYQSSQERGAIATADYHLGLVPGRDGMLFDRRQDPTHVHNLFEDPALRDVREGLTRRLVEHHRRVAAPEYAWSRTLLA